MTGLQFCRDEEAVLYARVKKPSTHKLSQITKILKIFLYVIYVQRSSRYGKACTTILDLKQIFIVYTINILKFVIVISNTLKQWPHFSLHNFAQTC